MDIYLAISYGERVFLYIIENKLIKKIDLLPYIIISIEDIFNIQFEDGEPVITRFCKLHDEYIYKMIIVMSFYVTRPLD